MEKLDEAGQTGAPGIILSSDQLGPLPIGAMTDGEVALLRAWAEDFADERVAAECERCAMLCKMVQAHHEAALGSASTAVEAEYRESAACGAQDCAEAIRMDGDSWFERP